LSLTAFAAFCVVLVVHQRALSSSPAKSRKQSTLRQCGRRFDGVCTWALCIVHTPRDTACFLSFVAISSLMLDAARRCHCGRRPWYQTTATSTRGATTVFCATKQTCTRGTSTCAACSGKTQPRHVLLGPVSRIATTHTPKPAPLTRLRVPRAKLTPYTPYFSHSSRAAT